MKHLFYFLVMGAAMMGLSHYLPGFFVTGWQAALIAAVVLAVVNTIVKPILFVLTLPFTILSLGLFLFVLNAAMLALTAYLVPGFDITSVRALVFGSIALSVVSMIWKFAAADRDKPRHRKQDRD